MNNTNGKHNTSESYFCQNNTLITIVREPYGSSKSVDKVKLQMIYKKIVGAFPCTKFSDQIKKNSKNYSCQAQMVLYTTWHWRLQRPKRILIKAVKLRKYNICSKWLELILILKSMLKEVKIVTYVPVTLHLISTIACRKRKEHKLSTPVFDIKVQC